jgi:hypothetical protein
MPVYVCDACIHARGTPALPTHRRAACRFKAQAGTLEKMAGQHYEATVAAQQAAADSMQVAGDAHAQALGEVR